METLLAFFLAMSVTMVLTPPLIRVAERLRVLDQPEARKVHTTPVPRIGGVAIAAGMILPHLFWLPWDRLTTAYVSGAVLITLAGFWDDRRQLDWKLKLAAQIAAALCLMVVGDVGIGELTQAGRFGLPAWIAWPLTLAFLVGVTNAINLADGLDGLAGGTALLAASALCLLAWQAGAGFALTVGAALAGAVLSFLRFNTHPARVFMGDSGSQLLGFTLGMLAIVVTQSPSSVVSTALPLLLLGVPIIDTLSVMAQRIAEGRSPFVADRRHIHHRLLAIGLDHYQAVVVIYVLQGLLFLLAWWLRYETDLTIVVVFAAAALGVMVVLHLLARRAATGKPRAAGTAPSGLANLIGHLRAPRRLPAWTRIGIGLALPVYGAAVVAATPTIPGDTAVVAAALLAFLTLRLIWLRGDGVAWAERLALFLAASLLVYLDYRFAEATPAGQALQWAVFGVLAGCILLNWRLQAARPFRITPLDWLIVFLALVVPNLPAAGFGEEGLSAAIAKLMALFYGIETLATDERRRHRLLTAGAMVGVGAVLVRLVILHVIPLS